MILFHPKKNTKVLDSKTSNKLLGTVLGVGLYTSGLGIWGILNNPQILTDDEQLALYNSGYNQQPYVRPVQDNAMSWLQLGVGGFIIINGVRLLAYEKPKNMIVNSSRFVLPDFPLPPEQKMSLEVQQEQEKKEKFIQNVKRSALETYLNRVFKECPWMQELIDAQAIIYVGEGGSGKSRLAMCVMLCQLICKGIEGSSIEIFDSQGSKNIEAGTWVAGNIYEYEAISSKINMIKGDDRNGRSPFQAILIDEAARMARDGQTRPILKAAMASAKEDARSRQRCIHFTCHSWMRDEWGGDHTVSLRSALFRAAKVVYFPAKKTSTGALTKSDLVLIRDGITDDIQPPVRLDNNDSRFNYAEDWKIHAIPDFLDPSEFLKNLQIHITALQNDMKIHGKEEVPLNPKIEKMVKGALHDTQKILGLIPDMDQAKRQLQTSEILHDFEGIINPVRVNKWMLKHVSDSDAKFLQNCDFKVLTSINGCDIIETKQIKGVDLKSLSDEGLGQLSESGKYWIHPILI